MCSLKAQTETEKDQEDIDNELLFDCARVSFFVVSAVCSKLPVHWRRLVAKACGQQNKAQENSSCAQVVVVVVGVFISLSAAAAAFGLHAPQSHRLTLSSSSSSSRIRAARAPASLLLSSPLHPNSFLRARKTRHFCGRLLLLLLLLFLTLLLLLLLLLRLLWRWNNFDSLI